MLYVFPYCIFTDLLMLLNPGNQSPPRILWHNVPYLHNRSTYGGWEGVYITSIRWYKWQTSVP